MKIVIDRVNCVSCGSCWEACPDIFEQDPDDSLSRIAEPFRLGGKIAEGEPPADREECAARAADECCAAVIAVE